MPDLGATAIISLISAAVAAGGTGVSIYESDKSRDAASQTAQDAQLAQQQQQAQQQAQMKARALAVAGPNAQSQTGGSLTGPGNQSFADILAGYAGANGSPGTNNAAATVGATNAPQQPTPGAAPNIQDLLKQLGGGQNNFSGGSGTPPSPEASFSLSPSY